MGRNVGRLGNGLGCVPDRVYRGVSDWEDGVMKIALYIEDGLEQIVLTPETDTEKSILSKFTDDSREIEIKHGSFYGCRGGWIRYKPSFTGLYGQERQDDESTMIVLRDRTAEPEFNP